MRTFSCFSSRRLAPTIHLALRFGFSSLSICIISSGTLYVRCIYKLPLLYPHPRVAAGYFALAYTVLSRLPSASRTHSFTVLSTSLLTHFTQMHDTRHFPRISTMYPNELLTCFQRILYIRNDVSCTIGKFNYHDPCSLVKEEGSLNAGHS